MNRRAWILTSAAAAAVGGALWRWRATPPHAGSLASDAAGALWQASFATPGGAILQMSTLRGRPLVLNFWATWCAPCVKEMPDIDRFARGFGQRGGQVVGLAVDNPKAVREYLERRPVSYTIALAGLDGTELSRKLGNPSGALPFTAAFDRSGALVREHLGQTSFDELMQWSESL